MKKNPQIENYIKYTNHIQILTHKRDQAEVEGKTSETKKPIIVKYGLKHIIYLIE